MRKFIQTGLLVTLLLLLFTNKSQALNYYWVGGTGNWDDLNHWATSSGGTVLHNQIPRAVDNVFFDRNSFSATGQVVTLNPLTILCNDMDWAGVTNTPSLVGGFTHVLKLYGSLKLSPGMIATQFNCEIYFEAISPGKTVLSAGKLVFNFIHFNGIGGGWTLQDSLTVGNIELTNGTFNTNNHNINTTCFFSYASTTRAFNMGSSVMNVSQWLNIAGTGLTLNCGTSVINMTNNVPMSAEFSGGDQTFYDVNFTGPNSWNGWIKGNNRFHDVVFSGKALLIDSCSFRSVIFKKEAEIRTNNNYTNIRFEPGFNYTLNERTVQRVSGTITANGNCGAYVNISSNVQGSQCIISHPAGAVNLSYAILKDVRATGGATFTASNSINISNNAGWSFTSPVSRNLYWVGNGGNWDDGSHWSFTSGGSPSGCSPSPLDNVFFDANSFSLTGQSVTINTPNAYCWDMNWRGVTNTPRFDAVPLLSPTILKIYGSLQLAPSMNTTSLYCQIHFEATITGKTISLSGQSLETVNCFFNGIGGGWTLQDTFKIGAINLNNGTLNTNNQLINTVGFYSITANTRRLNLGSSTINVAQYFGIEGTGMTLNCGTSVINMSYIHAEFTGGGLTYFDVNFTDTNAIRGWIKDNCNFHDVVFHGRALIWGTHNFHSATFKKDADITTSNTYTNIHFEPGYNYKLDEGTTQRITGNIDAAGNCGAFVNIFSSRQTGTCTISHPAGPVNVSYVILKDVQAIGGATYTASNSINISNNTGWNFTSPLAHNLYWVGNSGNWADGNHWSFTSGGAPSGCSPSPLDNVFFDANSFSLTGQSVTINTPNTYCRDMNWTGVTNRPLFTAPPALNYNIFRIYGSVKFATAMTTRLVCNVTFEATTAGKTIAMVGQQFDFIVDFNGISGVWTLQDTLNAGIINLNSGTLNTNNQIVNTTNFSSRGNFRRTLNMGTSTFNVSQDWGITDNNMTLNCGTSTINCTLNAYSPIFAGNGLTYYDVNFTGQDTYIQLLDNNKFHDVVCYGGAIINDVNTFRSATFKKDAEIRNSNRYDDCIFTAGHTYKLASGTTQTITKRWQIQGSCVSYIFLRSLTTGSPARISKPSGSVAGYNIHIKDIACSGGAAFNAYNSVNLGGNSGWLFSLLPPLLNPDVIRGPSIVCTTSGTVTYHIAPVPGAIYYEWTVPTGATIVSGQGDTLITVRFDTVTNGSIVVQTFNGCNYGTRSSAFPVSAGPAFTPLVSLAANDTTAVCAGTSVRFTAAVSNAGTAVVQYIFKVNGITVQDSSLANFSSASLANGDVVSCDIRIVNGGGCFSTTSATSNPVTIAVNPVSNVAPAVSIAASPAGAVCSGTALNFTAQALNTASGNVTYDFLINGTSVQSGPSNTFTSNALLNNDQIVCKIHINGGTCLTVTSAADTSIAVINARSTPAVAVSAHPGTTICAGTPATFTALATNTGGGILTYLFKVNGIGVQSGSADNYMASSLSNGDRIDCMISIAGGACINSDTASAATNVIAISSAVKPVIAAASGTNLCEQNTINLTAGSGYSSYLWNTGSNTAAIPVDNFGLYSVVVKDANGCTASDSIELVNDCDCALVIPNIFTPNQDGYYDKWIIDHTTCIRQVKVAVYNRWGGLVYQTDNYQNNWQGMHNGTVLPDATYYYIIQAVKSDGSAGKMYKGNVTIMR